VKTDFVFYLDVDFIPSENFIDNVPEALWDSLNKGKKAAAHFNCQASSGSASLFTIIAPLTTLRLRQLSERFLIGFITVLALIQHFQIIRVNKVKMSLKNLANFHSELRRYVVLCHRTVSSSLPTVLRAVHHRTKNFATLRRELLLRRRQSVPHL
jgi:hypothetical protein